MIRVGIVGTQYGCDVLLPAFRADARCRVTQLAGRDPEKTAARATAAGIEKAQSDWRDLVGSPEVDAVAIAALPAIQPEIAIAALRAGKPVFAEKPMAGDLDGARAMLDAANASGLATGVDFNFHQIAVWQRAKAMLDAGEIGTLRHVAVHWHVENRATALRLHSWKTAANEGGGVLGNFVSHCFHYVEWLCGPLMRLGAETGGLPGTDDSETTAMITLRFASGALGSLSVSCASYRGTGHRIELYGDDGNLILENRTGDYMRGFELWHASRRTGEVLRIAADDPAESLYPDGRVAPTARLVKKFIDAIEMGSTMVPGFAEGYRVQQLIEAARESQESGVFASVRTGVK